MAGLTEVIIEIEGKESVKQQRDKNRVPQNVYEIKIHLNFNRRFPTDHVQLYNFPNNSNIEKVHNMSFTIFPVG